MFRFVALLVAGLAFFSLGAQAQQPLKLMANTSPPYADARLPQRGLALELVEHVFSSTSVKPEISIENWSRAVEGAKLGVYKRLAAVWYSEERAQDLLFSEPYLSSKLIILKRRNEPRNFTDLRQLSGARLGVRTDYAYGVDLAAIPRLTLVEENHLIQNLLNLLSGKVDFVIGDRRTIIYQLNEYLKDRLNQFSVTGIQLQPVARHVAISRSLAGHEDIIAEFNAALARAESDGSHQAIIDKWDQRYVGVQPASRN
ncbi:transporter substrate-binding domain-containing protein [Seongchinamella unica]|uniref:Transporter substrate-binding domain-containing protein n=1 Tax=Seongchinamella unica TaxID=2547392 RepID=A0A4R5LRH8_9GAMM|nr:transporter substrate-binding domain-containing protein [Seongchinamella unica]TDG13430.1 transporter substrate-binding domain-containing protein [Seongchinamella unica]